ncbi:LOW QUALITY PROTEIN: E3 ubiquitin-protein ligase HRD1 [Paramyrothecium foliicola]|nr:LOW QUALITY PROTEIN: E3 ubiquitin-protein ligase HRD1 [Paramyrothecium foliicola]
MLGAPCSSSNAASFAELSGALMAADRDFAGLDSPRGLGRPLGLLPAAQLLFGHGSPGTNSFIYGLSRLCFGRLRAVEVEQLTERAWFAITETCLAMTIIREERGAWFLVMFTALVTGKVWGWICDGRVEILEQQPPANPRLFHTRLSISLLMSFFYDVFMLRYIIIRVIREARPNMMVMFLFEFAILTASSWRTGARYLLSVAEQNIIKTQTRKRLLERRLEVRQEREAIIRRREQAAASGEEVPENQEPLPSEDDIDEMDIEVPGWAAKGEFVLWLDLVTDLTKLGIYIAFFFMLLRFYGLPIHIMRDLFMTSRDFIKRLHALLRYRKAMREMNRHPDATEEDLSRESTCIICREEMRPWDPVNNPGAVDRVRPKKLPCGHILHLGCLKSWLERQQVCPTCRAPVTEDRNRGAQNRAAGIRIQIGGAPFNQRPQPQGVAPRNGGQPGQNDGQPQPQQANGQPRVFNLGPIRLGFGANNQQARELVQQFGLQQPVANQMPGLAPLAAPPQGLAANIVPGNNMQSIGNLIAQAEQLVQREVQTLQNTQQELQTLHLLLAELQRVRQRQQQQPDLPPLVPGQAASPNVALPPGFPAGFPSTVQPPLSALPNLSGFPSIPPRISSPFVARHGTTSNATAIPSGSPELPEGVVIPPGWSLMPLQRLDGPSSTTQVPPPPPPPTGTTPTQSSIEHALNGQSSSGPFTAPQNTTNGSANTNIEQPPAGSVPPLAPTSESSAVQPADPTPVVSPSPVVPNWGGSAQLFHNSSRLDQSEAAGPSAPQSDAPTAKEAPAAVPSAAEGASLAQHESDKGKAKAVTVEDVDEDEEEDDDTGDDSGSG